MAYEDEAIAAYGYRCVWDAEDYGASLFAKVEDGMLKLIQGMDFGAPDNDHFATMLPADELGGVVSAVRALWQEPVEGSR